MSGNEPDALLLSEKQAAKLCGVSTRTLVRWRAELKLPYLRAGRTIRYPVELLRRWIREKSQQA